MASNSTPTNPSSPSSSKTKDEVLNELLTCGICLSRMTLPCCLPCAHPFCRQCLLDYARNSKGKLATSTMSILCPYCKYQMNFRSLEHFDSMLVVNPVLKQLCEALDTSTFTSEQLPNGGLHRARCHTCCLLQMLKVCKHCFFMLCETCRRTHLLDVHRESQIQLDMLDSHLCLIAQKRLEMDEKARQYDDMRERIRIYVERCVYELQQQRDCALQMIDERQRADDDAFWTGNGFETGEKLDFFVSLVESGRKKLLAKNITDKELMELADNLQTIPNINEKTIQSIRFGHLTLELEETLSKKQYIHIYDHDQKSTSSTPTTTPIIEKSFSSTDEQGDCIDS